MIRIALIALVVMTTACKKDEVKSAPPAPAPPAAAAAEPAKTLPAPPPATPDGPRKVAIEVNKDGYTPAKIPGKPGEKLTLVFTRTMDSSCIAKVKTPDGKLVDLPMNTPVEVAVTVPQQGEVGFACGMDMFHGVVVAEPAG